MDGPTVQIQLNIEKSKRAAFRLFGACFHGKNGLLVLTYGQHIFHLNSETIKPIGTALIKQVLSISENIGDAVFPVLTGILSAQAIVKFNALAIFGSICRDEQTTVSTLQLKLV